MKATDFEFRNRFWIFGLIFGLGFWLYALDHVNVVQYLVNSHRRRKFIRTPICSRAAASLSPRCSCCSPRSCAPGPPPTCAPT